MVATYRAVWHTPAARTLVVTAGVSSVGDWIGLAGLAALAFSRSGSVLGVGSMLLAQGTASVVGTVLLGPHLDRVERRVGLQVTYVTAAAGLVVGVLVPTVSAVVAAAAVAGLSRPVAASFRHAIIGSSLPPEVVGPTVATQKAVTDVAGAFGLAAGGALAVTLGPVVAVVVDAGTFVGAAAGCAFLARSRADRTGRPQVGAYRFVATSRAVRPAMLMLLVLAAVGSIPETVAPALAGDSGWFPAVLAAQAVGSAVGGLAVGGRRGLERPRVFAAGTGMVGVALCGCAAAVGSLPALTAANLLLGVALSVVVLGQTTFVRVVPADRLGSATAAAITMVMAAEGAGAWLVAAAADHWGVGVAHLAAAAVAGAGAAAGLWPQPNRRRP